MVGAIYLDGGFDAARNFVLKETSGDFERIARDPAEVNPKGVLQELLQAIEPEAPIYELLDQSGPEHPRNIFVCRASCGTATNSAGATARARSRRRSLAANDALEKKLWETNGSSE